MRKTIALYLIIAFLSGMVCMDYVQALKVPDITLKAETDPNLREIIKDYVINILNNGRYQCRISSITITSSHDLEEGEILFDDGDSTKYLIVSDGTTNYKITLTAL